MDKNLKKIFISGILIIFTFFALKYVFIYFSPFIIAIVLATLINPLVNKIENNFNLNRGLTVFIILLILISIIVVIAILGISQAYIELNTLLKNLPDYNTIGDRINWLIKQNNRIQEFINSLDISEQTRDMLNSNLQLLYDGIRNLLIRLSNYILTFITRLPLIFTILLLSFIATFFISRDKEIISKSIINLFPGKWENKIYKIRDEILNSIVGFVRAELILITITGIIVGLGLTLLGNPYALVIGIGAAILDLIPIIGPGLIFYPWILINLVYGNTSAGFSLLIIYLILAAVRSGTQGKVMGESLGIHPLSTMIALYVGFRVMGGMGFIIGPTLLILLKAIVKANIISYEE